ncbi:MAG TPA: TetR family transcriptional regulator [Candidatus Acidoferrum sp.]|nr:TetR family transcriptional regulator [Candidatus Acidoferrum sp.]
METISSLNGATRKNRQTSVVRDPEKTSARILAAALTEFSAKGFAGARVDAIARRAGTNKRMLYHYFGDKEALFRAVLTRKITERQTLDQALTGNPEESIPVWFSAACQDPDWVRMLEWEALQYPKRNIIRQKKRVEAAEYALKRIRQGQKCGRLSAELDPAQMLLTFRSLIFFPIAFPQLTRMITGREVSDPKFQRDRIEFLTKFARAFRPRPAEKASKRTKASNHMANGSVNGHHGNPRSKSSPRRTGILA